MKSIRTNLSSTNTLPIKISVVIIYLVGAVIFAMLGISCIWREMFGVICPGCGYTHALLSALQFDFDDAWEYHPLFWTFPFIVLFFIKDGKVFKNEKLNVSVLCLGLILFIIVWIVRL